MTTQSPVRTPSRTSRRAGYAVTVVIDAVLLFLLNVSPGWQALPFLTDSFADALPWVNLNLAAAVLISAVEVVIDPPWLVAAGQAVLAVLTLAVAVSLLRVFPFDFSAYSFGWEALTRFVLWVTVLGASIGFVVSVVTFVRAAVTGAPDR